MWSGCKRLPGLPFGVKSVRGLGLRPVSLGYWCFLNVTLRHNPVCLCSCQFLPLADLLFLLCVGYTVCYAPCLTAYLKHFHANKVAIMPILWMSKQPLREGGMTSRSCRAEGVLQNAN